MKEEKRGAFKSQKEKEAKSVKIRRGAQGKRVQFNKGRRKTLGDSVENKQRVDQPKKMGVK